MRNPLIKRLPREFLSEIGKYLVIYLFMTGTIGFISGFLVADSSCKKAYDESYEKYNSEDGNFELEEKANSKLITTLEKENVKIYKNFYFEAASKGKSKLRVFTLRNKVNKVCLLKGKLPKKDDEIAIDRLYAKNNKIKINDIISVSNKKLKVTGFVALPDYSALFENNNEIMFDAISFGVSVVNKNCFNSFTDENIHYSYSWKYNKTPKNDTVEKHKSDAFLKVINKNAILKNYIPRYSNQSINFAGDDMGGDKSIMITLLYILIVIIAFVLAVTTSNIITQESLIIGTLRASGYSKKEILIHYMSLPLIVTLIAACIGNILGYTIFKNIMADLYYESYSLTTYKTLWNSEAFILTTIIPFIIMLVVNFAILINKLSLSPLKFLRNDLKKKEKKKVLKLTKFKFFTRFRLRVIFQNMPGYTTLFIGIIFANLLLMFGMMMTPLINHYQKEIKSNLISNYQYILKAPIETNTKGAEKYAVKSLDTYINKKKGDSVNIFGINKNSKYVNTNLDKDTIYISDGLSEKYNLKVNDKITLKEEYSNDTYTFKIKGIYKYPSSLAIFMSKSYFNETFNKDKNYFNGYFTNNKIKDINKKFIASTITIKDMTKVADQLTSSMGNMFVLVDGFAVILYMLIIYLLSKLIIEKNATSISMTKILGYNNKEIALLYILSTSIVVIFSLFISLFTSKWCINAIYKSMISDFSGWITLYISPSIYVKMFVLGLVSYSVIAVLELFKIRKIPLDNALKSLE